MSKTKVTLLMILISIIGATGIGVTLYFTMGVKNASTAPSPDTVDLNEQRYEYLAKVKYMNKIDEPEVRKIKNEIKQDLVTKMQDLGLEQNIDYQIKNLEALKEGDNLNNYLHDIIIESSSIRATGKFVITLNVQENINDRKIEIEIDKEETDGLTEDAATSIKIDISRLVDKVLTAGQFNKIDKDYKISGLDSIKPNAKFDDYNGQIKVIGISNRVVGEFLLIFTII